MRTFVEVNLNESIEFTGKNSEETRRIIIARTVFSEAESFFKANEFQSSRGTKYFAFVREDAIEIWSDYETPIPDCARFRQLNPEIFRTTYLPKGILLGSIERGCYSNQEDLNARIKELINHYWREMVEISPREILP